MFFFFRPLSHYKFARKEEDGGDAGEEVDDGDDGGVLAVGVGVGVGGDVGAAAKSLEAASAAEGGGDAIRRFRETFAFLRGSRDRFHVHLVRYASGKEYLGELTEEQDGEEEGVGGSRKRKLRHGWGEMTWEDGGRYVGQWARGKRNGELEEANPTTNWWSAK